VTRAAVAIVVLLTAMSANGKGVLLEDLTWQDAERVLKPESVVVIPLGAAAKEHGPHLPLKNDWLIADYLTKRVLAAADVVVMPTVAYGYYPAFVEYPGSTSLRLETARDLIVDICRSVARHGPRRFYVLNTGISTVASLEPAAEVLRKDGIVLAWLDTRKAAGDVRKAISKQEGGSHADEIETSMMLYMAPQVVQMAKAVHEFNTADGPLTRNPKGPGCYSASGVYGDATLATREKGEKVTEAIVAAVLREIEQLRKTAAGKR
jgi:creatinine amidohydrolase